MWKFLKSHWIMSLIGLVILLTAAVSLIWAIATREGDIGLFTGTKGQVLRWESVPITCTYDPDSNVGADMLDMYDDVRREINSKFSKPMLGGCVPWGLSTKMPDVVKGELVLRLGEPPEPEEGVTVFDPFEPEAGGTTHLMEGTDGRIAAAVLYISEKHVKNKKVWKHELGHVMGLDHDRRMDSIMYKTLTDRGDDISDKDVKALEEAYR